jgi:4-amino-4-deoxy-L-arabinose transferase-like glycosyltransferase
MNRNLFLFLSAVVVAAMLTGVHHGYLFGPDEPREAEIARETLKDNHWIVPRLCGLPFLEKPPLYYDLVAFAYVVFGSVTPTVARSVSMAFGILMIVPVFAFANRWRDSRMAWLAVLALLTMPRFWRYSHVILLDIAVGAFCTWAIVCFAWSALRNEGEKPRALFPWLCAVFSAAAFLTKGVPALFSIAAVVAGFCLVEKRWDTLKALFSPLPLLSFLIPVGLWVFLLYREGGIAYLHEHFVNNLAGRFLQKHFELADMRFYHTDLGHREPWYFYIQRMPEILGLWVVILPFAVWGAFKQARNRAAGRDGAVFSFLLVWALLPVFFFSFSGIKERTYILPSYAGMAILIGAWLDRKLRSERERPCEGIGWLWIVFPFSLFSILAGQTDAVWFGVTAICALCPVLIFSIILLAKKRFTSATYAVIAIMLCVLIVSHSPNILYARFKRKCYLDLAAETRRIVGAQPLYFYRPSDNIRGSVSFYSDRTIQELGRPEDLKRALSSPQRVYVIMEEGWYEKFINDPSFFDLLYPIPAQSYAEDPDNMLLTNKG